MRSPSSTGGAAAPLPDRFPRQRFGVCGDGHDVAINGSVRRHQFFIMPSRSVAVLCSNILM